MVTLRELAEDWIQGRAALKLQLKRIEEDAGLSEDDRNAIVARIKSMIREYDDLLKEHPNA